MKSLRIFSKVLSIIAVCACGFSGRVFAAAGDTVHVEFVDGGNGTVFGSSDMKAADLPDSFAANTKLTIKGEEWAVVSSDPVTKLRFTATGKLTLVLSRVVKAQATPKSYTSPTIAGDAPKVSGTTPPGDDVYSIQEDDWRQVEFVAQPYEKEILEELADIHDIKADAASDGGFKNYHVRKRIPEPLLNFALKDVEASFPKLRNFPQGVGFVGSQLLEARGTVPHSFAWSVDPGLVIWGVTNEGGYVTRLCLSGSPQRDHVAAISAMIAKFTDKYNVSLVDWCRVARIHGSEQEFEKYFNSKQ